MPANVMRYAVFRLRSLLLISVLSMTSLIAGAAPAADPAAAAQAALEKVDPFMGDWSGAFTQKRGPTSPLAAQVIALGRGLYHANLLPAFDKRVETIATLEGRLEGAAVRFHGWGDVHDYRGPDWHGAIKDGVFTGEVPGRWGGTFRLHKVVRLSPTLGAAPPSGAVVLFDGTTLDGWQRARGKGPAPWKLIDGAMQVAGTSIASTKRFTYCTIHLEFRTPFDPEAREQSRGNSGVSIHGREVQVLDTYGLAGREKQGGAIYNRAAPLVNMCAPPMQWQTYDITVRRDENGANRLTVLHNGVVIHKDHELNRELRPSSLRLQEHGSPVQYRNIWAVVTP